MSTKEITIAGALFTVTQPYAAGHVITEAEANALNQTRSENIRNNCAKAIKEGKFPEGLDAAGYVAQYDANYVFNLASAGGAVRVTDPLEKEARRIAREELTARIKQKGGKVKDVDKDAFESKVAEWAANPKVIDMAKKNLKARKELALSLGEDGGEDADSAS